MPDPTPLAAHDDIHTREKKAAALLKEIGQIHKTYHPRPPRGPRPEDADNTVYIMYPGGGGYIYAPGSAMIMTWVDLEHDYELLVYVNGAYAATLPVTTAGPFWPATNEYPVDTLQDGDVVRIVARVVNDTNGDYNQSEVVVSVVVFS